MGVKAIPSHTTAGFSLLLDGLLSQLPQTQCRQCGFEGCRPYAQAILEGNADINQCPPGGQAGVDRLANYLGREHKLLNPAHGLEGQRVLAVIREDACIGCTLCIQACPVDAIVGAAKQMHTVISDRCTGCRLCVPPCPMDCIDLPAISQGKTGWQAWPQTKADQALLHFEAREQRLKRSDPHGKSQEISVENHSTEHQVEAITAQSATGSNALDVKQSLVQKALQAAKDRHSKPTNPSDLE